jgi:peptide/nickel transport system permease protein
MADKQYKSRRLASFRKFLSEYRRSRLGIAGVVIILFFSVLALSAPLLTNHNPITDQNLAAPYSVPQWARIFPQYSKYPLDTMLLQGTQLSTQSDLANWKITSLPSASDSSKGFVNYSTTSSGLELNFVKGTSQFSIFNSQSGIPTIMLNQTFNYPWVAPCGMTAGITVEPLSQNISLNDFSLDIYMTAASGKTYQVMSPDVYTNRVDVYQSSQFKTLTQFEKGVQYNFVADSKDPFVNEIASSSSQVHTNQYGACGVASAIFSKSGKITISYIISILTSSKILVSNPFVYIPGSAYGVLGTDDLGRDVWSQFVYGARISLAVGLVAALIAVVLGTAVGLTAGFVGGMVDEGLMRFNDFLLTLPFLPLVLVLLVLINLSHLNQVINTETVILLLLALLGWNGIARVIRSQVLSIKQRQFVEASRALGGKDRHIIWRHVLPNVMGLVYANVALSVPSFILLEAALTFLGFGDPSLISWGTMLANAESSVTSAHYGFVWWWFLPPGIAIAVLSMAFVFVGFSLDAVLNPRLRQR